jgi:ABC-type multidrug transport system fused ATPase/permease subunit
MSGAFSVGNALPYMNAVTTAMGVARNLYGVIDRVPEIDASSKSGKKPKDITGKIEVKNVEFSYPSRPTIKVSELRQCLSNSTRYVLYQMIFRYLMV